MGQSISTFIEWVWIQKIHTQLYVSCRFGIITMLNNVIINTDKYKDTNHKINYFTHGMQVACKYGQLVVIPRLITYGVHTDRYSIIAAVCYGHLDILKYIHKINVDMITDIYDLAFYACLCNQKNVVQWLLDIKHVNDKMACIRATDTLYIQHINDCLSNHYIVKNTYGDHLNKKITYNLYHFIKSAIVYDDKHNIAHLILDYS